MRAPLQPERDQVRGRERHDYIAWNVLYLLWEIAFETTGYRHLARGEYLIFYKVLPSVVRVYRVLHGRRRYQNVL